MNNFWAILAKLALSVKSGMIGKRQYAKQGWLSLLLIGLVFCSVLFSCSVLQPTSETGIISNNRLKLNLSHSHLTEIPAYVFKLTDLKVLNLHHNKITHIPPEIKNLVNLEKLIISRNDLTEIPPEIGALKNLKTLSLKANKIKYLPSEIGELQNLELCRLSFNQLTYLPPSIGQLKNLSHFYIDYNRIEILPNELGNMTGLREFIIGRNQLNQLPAEFYTLTSLNTLDISYAGPTLIIAQEICQMRSIETLYIDAATLNFAPRCIAIRANGVRFNLIIR